MITAERAIFVLRRDLTIGSALKFAGGLAVAAAVLFSPGAGAGASVMLVVMGAVVGSAVVGVRNAQRSAAAAADGPSLIAAGEYDEAEAQIERTLGTFWSLRSAKLMGVHRLAVLRHAQRRWRESALLSRALLNQRLAGLPGVARTSRLLLADSLVELGDLPAAHAALAVLYAQRLTLAEAMNLLVVQLEYEARAAAWPAMLANVGHKVQLAELLPAAAAARTQGLLALAALRSGRPDLAAWLRRRAELLADVDELVAHRPALAEVFGAAQDAPPPASKRTAGGLGDTEVAE